MGLGVGLCDGSLYRSLEIDRDMAWTEDTAQWNWLSLLLF